LQQELKRRGLSAAEFSALVSPHMEWLEGRPAYTAFVSKQWIAETIIAASWRVPTLEAISKALNVPPTFWLTPVKDGTGKKKAKKVKVAA